jgi:predicted nuclease of restriction endonuclease-like RecB superfamily
MLTADLIRPRLRVNGQEIFTRPVPLDDSTILQTAADLIQLFEAHIGQPRWCLSAALQEYEGDRLDYTLIRGLAKVLSDAATFASEPPIEPVRLREALFHIAAERSPVVARPDVLHPLQRSTLIAEAAAQLEMNPETLESALYADLLEEQVLTDLGPGWSPRELLARYNLELARGLLYWASEMRVTVRGSYKDLFKYIKLFKLMHTIQKDANSGYAITLDGPISPFVQATLRYGRQMAKFLPALMLCPDWTMEADIRLPRYEREAGDMTSIRSSLRYRLDSRSGLRTHYPASGEYDSRLEADFAAEFEAKFGGAKRKWRLAREDEIISVGDTVMIPDFSFTHIKDGRRALLEIAGFWHPDYLRRKAWKLREAGRQDLILLAYEGASCTAETWADAPGEVLLFKNKPVLKDVLAAVERRAVLPS